MALIDKYDLHKKIREEYDRHKAIYDLYHHIERGGIVQGLSYASMILCKQPEISGIDRSAILRLCNEIEDIACDISQQTMNDIVSAESRMIFDKAKEIAAELTAPPKSNGNRIRQMTDEELVMTFDTDCTRCAKSENCELRGDPVSYGICVKGNIEWLKQEVKTDDER